VRRSLAAFAIGVVLLAAPALSAPPIDWGAVHATTMRGIDRFYRLDTDGAISAFDSVAQMAPGDPRGPFFRSIVHFSLFLLDQNRKDHDAFFRYSERTVTVCEQLLDQNDHDAVAKFYLGGILGYRGMLEQSEGSMLDAISEGRRGYKLLEEAVEERPDLYDAQMGLGLFRYLVTKAPRQFHWVLKLVGISPDLEGGLQMLRLAAEKGLYTRNEARLYLAQFLLNERRTDEAYRYMNDLCKSYPENSLFFILRAGWHQRDGEMEEAFADAQEALRLNSGHKLRYVDDLAFSTLGSIYFSRNDFAASRKYYMMYTDSLRNPQRISNWLWYRFAVACDLSGDRIGAKNVAARTKEKSQNPRPNESYYYRRAQELLAQPMGPVDAALVRASNLLNVKDYDGALREYQEAVDRAGSNQELSSRGLLGIAQTQFEMQRYSEVVQTCQRLLVLSPQRELWTLPQGYFKLGQALAKLHKTDDARRAFKMVKEFDDYDFQDQLERRVDEELDDLK
jgi:tetratricopeptide (TPR) repeat protein